MKSVRIQDVEENTSSLAIPAHSNLFGLPPTDPPSDDQGSDRWWLDVWETDVQ